MSEPKVRYGFEIEEDGEKRFSEVGVLKVFEGCKNPELIDAYMRGVKDGLLKHVKDKIAAIDENEFTTPTDVKRRAIHLIEQKDYETTL